MTQVEIAKKILEQGNCRGISCSGDGCEFLMKYSNNCRMQLGNTSDIDLDKVKQWLKERESMIDLTVNQIVDPPVKTYCWNDDFNSAKQYPLMSIDHRATHPYRVIAENIQSEDFLNCSLTDPIIPIKKIKPWLTIEDVPVELWLKALCKHKGRPNTEAYPLSPYGSINSDGHIYEDLVYLPLGQQLDSEWLEMGEWV